MIYDQISKELWALAEQSEKELKERESDAQNGADQTGRNESC